MYSRFTEYLEKGLYWVQVGKSLVTLMKMLLYSLIWNIFIEDTQTPVSPVGKQCQPAFIATPLYPSHHQYTSTTQNPTWHLSASPLCDYALLRHSNALHCPCNAFHASACTTYTHFTLILTASLFDYVSFVISCATLKFVSFVDDNGWYASNAAIVHTHELVEIKAAWYVMKRQ